MVRKEMDLKGNRVMNRIVRSSVFVPPHRAGQPACHHLGNQLIVYLLPVND
jgi:hypothetical protein